MDNSQGTRKKMKKNNRDLVEITLSPLTQASSTNTSHTGTLAAMGVEIEIEPIFECREMEDDSPEASVEETDPIGNDPEDSNPDKLDSESSVSIQPYQKTKPIPSTELRMVTCDECGEDFLYTLPFTHEDKILLCKNCNEQYENEYKKVKFFSCEICKCKFSRRYYLMKHIKTVHKGSKLFHCNFCSKEFSQRSYLAVHKKIDHFADKAYHCKLCTKKFAQKATLIIHERKHTGEKPFECSVCKYQFAQKSHLIAHERLHSGEKPFSCDICQKQFSKKHHLTVHATVHSGAKPYSCDICNKRFSQKSSVNVHKRRFVCVMQTKC